MLSETSQSSEGEHHIFFDLWYIMCVMQKITTLTCMSKIYNLQIDHFLQSLPILLMNDVLSTFYLFNSF